MTYQTANEMFAALSEQIDDEDFVMRAVRTAFPQWKRDQAAHEKALSLRPISQPQVASENLSEIQNRRSVEQGSKQLLAALHREHPRVMQAHINAGRLVVMP